MGKIFYLGKTSLFRIFFLLGIGVSVALSAQSRSGSIDPKFRFEHLTVNEGLAHSDAMAVVQDREGFVWVGTNNGINRYDGYELRKYALPVNNTLGLPGNRIRTLYTDQKGWLWAGAEGTGLHLYNRSGDVFVSVAELGNGAVFKNNISLLTQTSINAISSSADGTLWVATQDYGVFSLHFNARHQIVQVGRVRIGPDQKADYPVASIHADERGRVWIGTSGQGLWIGNAQSATGKHLVQTRRVDGFPETEVVNLHRDLKGNLWASSDRKVFWLGKNAFDKSLFSEFRQVPYDFNGIQCIYSDSFGRFWVGTNFGLVMIEDPLAYIAKPDNAYIHVFLPKDTDPNSINSGRIHHITEDSFSNLWLAASSGGLNKMHLRPKQFRHLHRQPGDGQTLPNSFVNAISKDEINDQLWIGTRNGFSVYDIKTQNYHNYLSRESEGNVTGVDVSSFLFTKNLIWIGTRYNGIYTVKRNGAVSLNRLPALPGANPWYMTSTESMVADKSGQVWVATFGRGLHIFDAEGKYLRTFDKSNSQLPTNDLTFLLYDAEKDVIWLSTRDAGVLKLQEKDGKLVLMKQFKHEADNPNSLKVSFAWPLLKDAKGDIWIGTIGGGLHRLTLNDGKETITRYDHIIADQDIESILADKQGNLWLGGAGLHKFSPDNGRLLHYDVSDGLQSNSFKVGSAHQDRDGTMYFGGTNGITYFRPQDILSNPSPPIVRITRLRVLNKKTIGDKTLPGSSMAVRHFSDQEGVVIQAGENDFSFEFVGLNYVNSQKQTYAFMLEGYNKDWVQLPDGQRVASFANLPAGTYVFKVKADNGDGVWSVDPASVKVIILPPWWKTWWAYMVYTALAVLAFLMYRRISNNRIQLKNSIEMERLRSEKEKELSELKSQFFTSVSHEFRTPLTLILGPMEEFMHSLTGSESMRERVVMMHKQTRKLLNLVNQLLSFRKMESGHTTLAAGYHDVVVFVREIFLIFKLKADEYRLDYTLDMPKEEIMLWFDSEKLEMIITNLLSNAFKYTSAEGKVHLSLKVYGTPAMNAVWNHAQLLENFLEITVTDSGMGIQPEELPRIFDPYYQAANSRGAVGTGIGLALVKDLVKKHSGEVSVQSVYGKGTRFTVRLPFGNAHFEQADLAAGDDRVDDQEKPVAENEWLTAANPVSASHAKILIVEDNDDLRLYLKGLFDTEYQVSTSANGLDGWKKTLELQPDLVMSDITMPGMNGLELCKKIKQNLKTAHIPVILLTARAAAVQELEGLETGADDYIPKPFNTKILKAKVNSQLRSRSNLHAYYQRQLLLEPTEIAIPDEDRLFLESAMKIVEDNLMNSDFNVQMLVSSMNMSQSVFYRRIKNVTGQSVIEFIKDIRLKRAAQLLSNQHARISEVAFMVGIEDPKNFRVSFQKLFHMSPSQYAKMHRTPETVDIKGDPE